VGGDEDGGNDGDGDDATAVAAATVNNSGLGRPQHARNLARETFTIKRKPWSESWRCLLSSMDALKLREAANAPPPKTASSRPAAEEEAEEAEGVDGVAGGFE
jgi:hypothetical protein